MGVTRKRAKKIMMSLGFSRNEAEKLLQDHVRCVMYRTINGKRRKILWLEQKTIPLRVRLAYDKETT